MITHSVRFSSHVECPAFELTKILEKYRDKRRDVFGRFFGCALVDVLQNGN